LTGKADRALTILEEGCDDALVVLSQPEKDRVRLRTTRGIEWLNREMRRRERETQMFPTAASAFRLIGA
jgi:transposase-like protein